MALTADQSLQLYGTSAYTGWGETEASYDARNKGLTGAGDSSAGNPPPFNFDYAAEASKAYGELGPYYTRLIQWANGDMNKVLARLTEDYDKGLRIQKEDTATSKANVDRAQSAADVNQANTLESVKNNALARGLYQKSLDANGAGTADPFGGFGIPDVNFRKTNENFAFQKEGRDNQKAQLDTNLTRYIDNANTNKARVTADTAEANTKDLFNLEEQRKQQSGTIANERGSRAYQDYINKFSLA